MFLNARTGEFTPPGINDLALSNKASDLSMLCNLITYSDIELKEYMISRI